MQATGGAVARRLRWYWRMEAANAPIIPAVAWGLVVRTGEETTPAFWVAAAACALLLVIGALYWRVVLRRTEGASSAFDYWIPRLAAVEVLSLALVAAAAILIVSDFALVGGGWTAARVGATALAALAALEYVNYYKTQLQHFDNWADFKRLATGRGFRRAHLARDIANWRAARGRLRR